jgi:hypothetical protein
MSLLVSLRTSTTGEPRRRGSRRLRRELRAQDRRSARLAGLYAVDALLAEAVQVVEHGWTQGAWFTFVDADGRGRSVVGCSPRIARRLQAEQVVSACLVGALVQAAGGPAEARSERVQKAVEVTWHALFRGASEPVRWRPSSVARAGHVMDLVLWNDRPGRTSAEVAALLGRARELTRAERERTAERAGVVGTGGR